MSKAIVYTETGPAEVLHLADVDELKARAGQVRVQVRAAGVNPVDHKIRSGGFGSPSLPATPGIDVAGVVDQVGEDITDASLGDEVLGFAVAGSYAEHALVGEYVRKPTDMPWEAAATVPVAAETSWRVLDLLDVQAGDTVLIHGAAGSVGGIATQLAVARGATVIGTASEGNHEYLRSLGATPTTYGDGLVARVAQLAPEGIDAVFDVAGRGALPDSIELRGGTTDRIVTIADSQAGDLGVVFSGGGDGRSLAGLQQVADQFEQGDMVLAVRETLPLADAATAHPSQRGRSRPRRDRAGPVSR